MSLISVTPAGARVVVLLLIAMSSAACSSGDSITMATTSSSASTSSFSFTLAPSSITVSAGGSGLAIGTIRGAAGQTLVFTTSTLPNGVSLRVTSNTDSVGVTTKKVIVFVDAATVPGTYVVGIRLSVGGGAEIEAPLTLVVPR